MVNAIGEGQPTREETADLEVRRALGAWLLHTVGREDLIGQPMEVGMSGRDPVRLERAEEFLDDRICGRHGIGVIANFWLKSTLQPGYDGFEDDAAAFGQMVEQWYGPPSLPSEAVGQAQ